MKSTEVAHLNASAGGESSNLGESRLTGSPPGGMASPCYKAQTTGVDTSSHDQPLYGPLAFKEPHNYIIAFEVFVLPYSCLHGLSMFKMFKSSPRTHG